MSYLSSLRKLLRLKLITSHGSGGQERPKGNSSKIVSRKRFDFFAETIIFVLSTSIFLSQHSVYLINKYYITPCQQIPLYHRNLSSLLAVNGTSLKTQTYVILKKKATKFCCFLKNSDLDASRQKVRKGILGSHIAKNGQRTYHI